MHWVINLVVDQYFLNHICQRDWVADLKTSVLDNLELNLEVRMKATNQDFKHKPPSLVMEMKFLHQRLLKMIVENHKDSTIEWAQVMHSIMIVALHSLICLIDLKLERLTMKEGKRTFKTWLVSHLIEKPFQITSIQKLIRHFSNQVGHLESMIMHKPKAKTQWTTSCRSTNKLHKGSKMNAKRSKK